MNLLSIEDITKAYGERTLFQKLTFGIDEGDKIGVIGVNGVGKSTLLKIIAGLETADAGQVIKGSGVRVEYLPQNPEFSLAATVLEQVFRGVSPVMTVLRDYEKALAEAVCRPDDAERETALIRLSQQMDAVNGWQLESEAKAVLTKLGVTDFSARVGDLSGGQRKRIALAGALIAPTELLILDEPTNHIDNDTVAWLEQYLQQRQGALLMVTHDRYFLDRAANRILELDKGRLYSYDGNYSKFLQMRVEREELQQAAERKRQNLLRTELVWIQRGAKARSTKQKARIERFEKLQAAKPDLNQDNLELAAVSTRLGRDVIELRHITKSYGKKELIHDFSYILLRHDRVGIVGANGSGKSTLLNILAGLLTPDQGAVSIGQTVKIGYFTQENSEMDEGLRVIDYVREAGNYLPAADGQMISASQMLERFLFPPQLQWLPIAKCSGGEKRRLYLLRILMTAPNVLFLDEPTNDLDIQTLTVLEDYLDDFSGAVIAVSHDRYFLDRVVDKLFAFDAGEIKQYIGGYSDYLEERQTNENIEKKPEKGKAAGRSERSRQRQLKFTFKEQKEYDEIETIIAGVEAELQAVNSKMNTAGSDFALLQELAAAREQLESRLAELLDRWTVLNELAEAIAGQGKPLS